MDVFLCAFVCEGVGGSQCVSRPRRLSQTPHTTVRTDEAREGRVPHPQCGAGRPTWERCYSVSVAQLLCGQALC